MTSEGVEAELEKLLGKATPGVKCQDERYPFAVYNDDALGTINARFGGVGFEYVNTISDEEQAANAALYVAMRNHLPVLLTALSSQRERVGELEEALDRAKHLIDRAGLASNGEHWEAVMQYEAALSALTASRGEGGEDLEFNRSSGFSREI